VSATETLTDWDPYADTDHSRQRVRGNWLEWLADFFPLGPTQTAASLFEQRKDIESVGPALKKPNVFALWLQLQLKCVGIIQLSLEAESQGKDLDT
jgi:phosphatidylglycerophosphatase A